MPLSIDEIDRELADLEKRYQQDREDLLRARAYALRSAISPQTPSVAPMAASTWTPMSGKIPPIRSGIKTDRQIIREFLAGWTGTFTIKQLIAAAQRHEGSPASKFDQNLWASTIFWLCRNRFVEVVKPREGNKAGKYRVIVSPSELVTPRRRKNSNQSPIQDAVLEAIKHVSTLRFTKNDIIKLVQPTDPKRSEDVIGAVLHRLASHGIGARIFARSREGNIYEKL